MHLNQTTEDDDRYFWMGVSLPFWRGQISLLLKCLAVLLEVTEYVLCKEIKKCQNYQF